MRSLLLVSISFFLAEYAYSVNISATVDRDPVSLDESFEIIFEADASPDDEPDFSSLTKSVQVLSQRRSNNMSIINGKITRSQKWILTVIAKKVGMLHIPAINFGRDKSEAIKVEVVAAQHSAPGLKPVFIELDIDNKAPYVQAQVLCTVRLYLATSFSKASLSEPQPDVGTAVIRRIGEDKNYRLQRGQQLYQVIERQYAIYPQKSGVMTIAPILFQGQVGGSRFFANPDTVIKRSDNIVLNVKPIPAAFPGRYWLPATDVNVSEQWSVNPARLKQGEPVTRTLTLAAQGLLASQLPGVSTDLDPRLKSYADQPVLSDTVDKHGFLGTRKQKLAIVPADADTFSLPAVRIPWWNTLTDAIEYAELPSREITVMPAAPTVAAPVPDPPRQQRNNLPAADTLASHSSRTFWKEAFFLILFIWLISLLLFLSGKIKVRSGPAEDQQHRQDIGDAINAVRRACKENDPYAANQALLYWSRLYWPQDPATSLDEIGQRCDMGLAQLIMQLDRLLYSRQNASWAGGALLSAFERYLRQGKKDCKRSTSELEPLHYL